jgi:hypothetical protein
LNQIAAREQTPVTPALNSMAPVIMDPVYAVSAVAVCAAFKLRIPIPATPALITNPTIIDFSSLVNFFIIIVDVIIVY